MAGHTRTVITISNHPSLKNMAKFWKHLIPVFLLFHNKKNVPEFFRKISFPRRPVGRGNGNNNWMSHFTR